MRVTGNTSAFGKNCGLGCAIRRLAAIVLALMPAVCAAPVAGQTAADGSALDGLADDPSDDDPDADAPQDSPGSDEKSSAGESADEGDQGPTGADIGSRMFDEESRPPYELIGAATLPRQDNAEARTKPGHWTMGHVEARVNHFDYRGELETEFLDKSFRPLRVDRTPFTLRSSRPAILGKGNTRPLEFIGYSPLESRASNAAARLLTGRDGDAILEMRQPLQPLAAHQHYLVALAAEPALYLYLRDLDVVQAPTDWLGELDEYKTYVPHYRVIIPPVKTVVPVASSALCWTTTAYVVWDSLDPRLLNFDQRQALVDWLHWGGQLVVSGPGSISAMRGSFLEPYLPADSPESWQFGPEVAKAIGSGASISKREFAHTEAWTGIKLRPAADANVLLAVDNEPLIVERRVGRGRIVVAAFPLSDSALVAWPLYDALWNRFLLKRPSRTFRGDEFQPTVAWSNAQLPPLSPHQVSKVRYFTRDAVLADDMLLELGFGAPEIRLRDATRAQPISAPEDDDGFTGAPGTRMTYLKGNPGNKLGASTVVSAPEIAPGMPLFGPGVAAWDEFSASSHLARLALQKAAGIKVPEASFVVYIVAGYLLVLVPLNYLCFRTLGKVEWAWAAAPVIAIACTGLVTHLAQLDIGFARARTEIAVAEMQPGFSRAHVTRYTALYGSLGADYDVEFSDATGLALPFPTGIADLNETPNTIDFRRVRQATAEDSAEDGLADISHASLEGVGFLSNSTGMIHSEHMLEMQGTVSMTRSDDGRVTIVNNTASALRQPRVAFCALSPHWFGRLAARSDAPEPKLPVDSMTGATLPDLGPGASATISLEPIDADWVRANSSLTEASPADLTGADLQSLAWLAIQQTAPGETRLVARIDEELEGVTIRPVASQVRVATVLVAHLDYGSLPATEPDANARIDVQAEPVGEDGPAPPGFGRLPSPNP